ncbi:MAG TPA: LysM peptidoglycan-binding domain-containing protein, partial [Solirubrobacteraceae bacterium]|nr:LysM peptidoglycan-binding domain-containing protein [Solirubrobacteraceae bacterium]
MQRSLPAVAVAAATLLLAPAASPAAVHAIAPGETLSGIAAANGMSPATLAAANGLAPDALVIAGRTLQIPAPGWSATAAPGAWPGSSSSGGGHLVLPGETLSGIAAANGLSSAALAAANGLSPESFVIAGTRLQVPGAGSTTVVASAPVAAGGGTGGHLVAPGETLSGIAAAHGVSLSSLAAANGLSTTSFAIAGTRLQIPAAGSASGTSSTVSGTAAGGATGGHLVQPGETLSGIAAANGLSTAALAAANGLSTTSFVIAGTRVRSPARTTATAAPAAPEPMGGYTVRTGDTLSGLAARSGVSVGQIAY